MWETFPWWTSLSGTCQRRRTRQREKSIPEAVFMELGWAGSLSPPSHTASGTAELARRPTLSVRTCHSGDCHPEHGSDADQWCPLWRLDRRRDGEEDPRPGQEHEADGRFANTARPGNQPINTRLPRSISEDWAASPHTGWNRGGTAQRHLEWVGGVGARVAFPAHHHSR